MTLNSDGKVVLIATVVAVGDIMMIVVSLGGHRMNGADGCGINKVDVNLVSKKFRE